MLEKARSLGDALIVGINSDPSVNEIKGPQRPLIPESERAEVLAALEAVDLVTIFEEDTPVELIKKVKPHVLVKGGDYTKDTVVGREIVEAYGGEVVIVETLKGQSTTRLVERSKK